MRPVPPGRRDGRRAASGRAVLLAALMVVLLGWTVLAWPRVTLPFSAYASVVDKLDTDVVADAGLGLTDEQLAGIRGAIGTRPVAMVFLPADGPSESEVCQAVSPRWPGARADHRQGGRRPVRVHR